MAFGHKVLEAKRERVRKSRAVKHKRKASARQTSLRRFDDFLAGQAERIRARLSKGEAKIRKARHSTEPAEKVQAAVWNAAVLGVGHGLKAQAREIDSAPVGERGESLGG